MLLAWIIGFSLLGSICAVAAAAMLFLFSPATRQFLVPRLLSYATGTLLGAAFLGMIPAGLRQAAPQMVLATVLGGIVLFFVLEKLVLWRHCHETHCDVHGGAPGLILIGDAFHNFIDGLMIAAAFLTSIPLGIATSLAVVAHEVPQEVGDFAILLDGGYGRARALILNGLSSLATLPGAVAGYFWLGSIRTAVPYILALSAASFIYIALADLVPSLHRRVTPASSVGQLFLLVAGIATIAMFHL